MSVRVVCLCAAYKIFKEQVFDKYAPIARQFIIATVERGMLFV